MFWCMCVVLCCVLCLLCVCSVLNVVRLLNLCVVFKVSVSLPEWSKGLRSGRNVFERVGSNPTADIFLRNGDNQHTREVTTAP